ncbi:hypothetical protein HG535_0B04600 [Zygotorulaspora mrakii]|uniref:Uncharacterized protein n=1 Tax=Zygotorulaspora mrakii TaxID=42260 RepID=A0A7H9AYD4_ZYGMR|nr:uncharacterized protein HG535_0B04600 [Zygotorulaspora mrakii]QLG71418.1 hypothetical protein HG535_0B04600 [Zygotorulaspora mrakii]
MTVETTATKYKISTGRGGAGNIHTTDSQISPKVVPRGSQAPNILQPVFSTGRGGAGNMRRNVDAKLTRKAQDIGEDDDDADLESFSHSDEDYIGPVAQNGEEEEAFDRLASTVSGKSNTSNRLHKSRTKGTETRPKTIMLGRGGAGNIISPTTSKKSTKRKSRKNEKKGFWGNLKGIFS